MDQPENRPDGNASSFDAARDAAGDLRYEAEQTLRDLKEPGGLKSFFKFEKMYFPTLASILFILSCIGAVLFFLFGILGAFVGMAQSGFFAGLLGIFGVVVGSVVMIVMTRVWIEIALVAFKINDTLHEIRDLLKQK